MTRSLELALFRTFCVPRISALLDRTCEFQRHAQKRYDDTDIVVSELMEWGYDSNRGRAALHRMNQQHGRFKIANEDFLYVLSSFIYEPIRWNERFGWRVMCEQERLGLFYFWRQIGIRMGIRDIPEEYNRFERFNIKYEQAHFRYADTNHRVGTAVLKMFSSWFPRPIRLLIQAGICAIMDDPMIEGFGFKHPSTLTRILVSKVLKLRAWTLRWWPKRTRPRLRTLGKHRSYPEGYTVEGLGPPGT